MPREEEALGSMFHVRLGPGFWNCRAEALICFQGGFIDGT